jgi:hypothetical protein
MPVPTAPKRAAMIRTLIGLILLFATAVATAASLPDGPYVSTSASAVEEVPPDFAVLEMQFRTVRPAPDEVREAADAAQRRLLDVLEAFENAIRDRSVESMSFGEQFEFDRQTGERVKTGHYGQFSVRLEVDDFETLPELHYRLAGLQWQSLGNPQFRVDDRDAVENRLRRQALARARERARVLAEAGGMSLGPAWGIIHEPMHDLAGRLPGDTAGPPVQMARMAEADGRFALAIEPRPVRFELTVGAVFRLSEAE